MTGLMESVANVLRTCQWKFDYDEEDEVLHAGMQGVNGHWRVAFTEVEDGDKILMLSVFPQKALPKRRFACAALITRLNFGLSAGCFEMDYQSGQIHFKTVLPFAKGAADTEQLTKAILSNLACMDLFLPLGMKVIYANTSPVRALQAAERQRQKQKNLEDRGSPSAEDNPHHRRFMNN